MTHVFIAFDKFKDCMDAHTACATAAQVISELKPDWSYELAPLADGGEGFCRTLTNTAKGKLLELSATGPLWEQSPKMLNVIRGEVSPSSLHASARQDLQLPEASQSLAVIEMAQASGLESVPPDKRNPWHTTTRGTGELILASKHLDGILLGVGGSATNDLGLGALEALGLRALDAHDQRVEPLTPANWSRVERFDTSQMVCLPPIRIACDVINPLLGEDGCTAVYGPQKGLKNEDFKTMESAMERMAQLLCSAFDAPTSLLDTPGAGAAGGIACGLLIAYKAELIPGFTLVEHWLGLEAKINRADIILTGEGKFDTSSLAGKGPASILKRARAQTLSLIFAGRLDVCAEDLARHNISQAYEVGNMELPLEENLKRGKEFLEQALRKVISEL